MESFYPAWTRGVFRLHGTIDGRTTVVAIPALLRGEFAVHQSPDLRGWRISHAIVGHWMCWHQNVFRSEDAAVNAADQLAKFPGRWTDFFVTPVPVKLHDHFIIVHQAAKAAGDLLPPPPRIVTSRRSHE